MLRGEVWDARLDPIEGSEQAGVRPVVIVSRDAVNRNLSTVVGVPCTTYRSPRQLYPSRALVRAPDGGLGADTVVLGEQVRALAKHRLLRRRGVLSASALADVERAMIVTLDLGGYLAHRAPAIWSRACNDSRWPRAGVIWVPWGAARRDGGAAGGAT